MCLGLVRQYLHARRIVRAAEAGAAPRCAAVVIGEDGHGAVLRLLDGTDGVRALAAGPGNISWLGQGALVVLDGPLDGRMVAVSSAGRQDWACPRFPDAPED